MQFPVDLAPRIVLPEGVARIIDCASTGIKYQVPNNAPQPAPNTAIRGTVLFPGDVEVPVTGRVIWTDQDLVALQLDGPGISAETLDSSLSSVARVI